MAKTLIRGALVVLPEGPVETDVLIDGDRIAAIDADSRTAADSIVDAEGYWLLPGVIDDQVHFREPGATHKEDLQSGSRACAAGGVTTFLEMPNTQPPAIDATALQWKYRRASEVSPVNFGFYIGATPDNLAELQRATGIPGIKIFIGSSTGNLLVDQQAALEEIFAHTKLPICAHCEDETTIAANLQRLGPTLQLEDHSRIRDVAAAVVATRRTIDLAVRHQHRFHVLHVSTAAELELLESARPWVTAEACYHHLWFTDQDYQRLGSRIQMNPSVKSQYDRLSLWEGLRQGKLQVLATDHAPHTLEEKSRAYPASPSGLPAVENALALMLDAVRCGWCSLADLARWMSDAPARIWGLVGRGRIAVGYQADLVLVDPELERTIRDEEQWTKSGWSPWSGETLTGWPIQTWVNGQLVYDRGRLLPVLAGRPVVCDHQRGGFWATPDGIGV
jgi:dihydroorotase